MLLTSANGDSVELHIDGYEFAKGPVASEDGWDENWLTIAGRVDHGAKSWAFRDPCLTTWDAQELMEWLRSVADGTRPERLQFTEPNLSLEAASGESPGATVFVTLRGEAASPNTPDGIRWGEGCQLVLDMSLDALAGAASMWEGEVAAYPSR